MSTSSVASGPCHAQINGVRIAYQTAGRGEPPSRLKEQITNAQIDLKAQETLLDAKKKEAVGINARYDEDKRRYKEAIGRK